jgi:hypothetical protein
VKPVPTGFGGGRGAHPIAAGDTGTAIGATARSKGARDGRTTAGLVLGVVAIVVSVVMMVIAYNVLT